MVTVTLDVASLIESNTAIILQSVPPGESGVKLNKIPEQVPNTVLLSEPSLCVFIIGCSIYGGQVGTFTLLLLWCQTPHVLMFPSPVQCYHSQQ